MPSAGGSRGGASRVWGGPANMGGAGIARGALPSAGRTLPAATQKTAGTCPGPRSLRCYSCRSPGSDLRAWAACPAGGRRRKPRGQLIVPGTRTPQEPSLPLALVLIHPPAQGAAPRWAPGVWGTLGVLKCPEMGSCLPLGLVSQQFNTTSGHNPCPCEAEPGHRVDRDPAGW